MFTFILLIYGDAEYHLFIQCPSICALVVFLNKTTIKKKFCGYLIFYFLNKLILYKYLILYMDLNTSTCSLQVWGESFSLFLIKHFIEFVEQISQNEFFHFHNKFYKILQI